MRCREFAERLNEVLDERRTAQDDELLVAHAQDCQSCRQVLQAHDALLAGLDLIEPPAPASRFAERVVAAANEQTFQVSPARIAPWNFARIAALIGIAAAALLAVTLFVNSRGRDAMAQRERAADAKDRPAKHRANGVLLSATNAGRVKRAAATVVPPELHGGQSLSAARFEEYREAIHLFAERLPGAVEQLDSVEMYAPGIRPIRASFSVAIDTLRRTIPGGGDPRPGIPQAGNFDPPSLLLS